MLAWVATPSTLGGVFIIALRFLKGAHIEELGMVEGFIFGMISGFQPPRPLKSLPPPPGSLKTTPWSPLSLTRILGGGKLTPLELSSSG